jgi:hypothetical protein
VALLPQVPRGGHSGDSGSEDEDFHVGPE